MNRATLKSYSQAYTKELQSLRTDDTLVDKVSWQNLFIGSSSSRVSTSTHIYDYLFFLVMSDVLISYKTQVILSILSYINYLYKYM